MPRPKTITLNDVAKDSGVSYQTVSRVINDSPNVAPHTRIQVLASIEKLGYRPNNAARQLVTGKSRMVGIISYGTHQYGPAQMLLSMERALRQQHYNFALASVDELEPAFIEEALSELEQRQVEGIILITPLISISARHIQTLIHHKPCVIIDADPTEALSSVHIDQTDGCKQALEHLWQLGHTQIAEISGPLAWWDAKSRHETFQRLMEARGFDTSLSLEGNWTAQSGYEATRELLKKQHFTAILAANDQMALGAMRAVNEAGLTIPEEVSIVGFDDIPEAAYFSPPLTTIRQNFEDLGQHSVKCIFELIESPNLPIQRHLLKPELVVRSSTAPVKH